MHTILLPLAIIELFIFVRGILIYRKTGIKEYLEFAFLWLAATITSIAEMMINTNAMIPKIKEISLVIFIFAVYIHATRTMAKKTTWKFKTLVFFGTGYFTILVTTAILWEPKVNGRHTQAEPANLPLKMGFVEHPIAYLPLRNLFASVSFILILIAFTFFKVPSHDLRLKTAKALWQLTAVMANLMVTIVSLQATCTIPTILIDICALFALIPTIVIAIAIPEGYIMQFAQIYRAALTYEKIQMKEKEQNILEYIQKVIKILRKQHE